MAAWFQRSTDVVATASCLHPPSSVGGRTCFHADDGVLFIVRLLVKIQHFFHLANECRVLFWRAGNAGLQTACSGHQLLFRHGFSSFFERLTNRFM